MSRCARPFVPEPPDQGEPLVDDHVVHVCMPERLGALEELGREQVLAVRRQLDHAVRLRDAETVVVQQAERVVLVADQPAHRAERGLVLELAVHDRAPDPVPAVGANMTGCEDLPEDAGAVIGGHEQRRRTAGALVAEGLHLGDGHADLVAHRTFDGVAPSAAQIEVRGIAALRVRHRESLVGCEPGQHDEGNGRSEGDGVGRSARIHSRQQDLREADRGEEGYPAPSSPSSGGPGRGERIAHAEDGDRERHHGDPGEVVRGGTCRADRLGEDGHRRHGELHVEPRGTRGRTRPTSQEHDEMAPTFDEREDEHGRDPHDEDRGAEAITSKTFATSTRNAVRMSAAERRIRRSIARVRPPSSRDGSARGRPRRP